VRKLLVIVALIGAGCSNTPAETGNTGTNTNSAHRDKGVQFAECMRHNGVSAFPDSNAASDQEFVAAIKRAQDAAPAAWKKAIRACKDLRPAGLLGGKATPREMTERLKFAQCIRDHGVKDFPDPTRDGPLVDTNRIPSSATSDGMTTLNAAMHTCSDAAARALGNK
jgi:hypothetical protein